MPLYAHAFSPDFQERGSNNKDIAILILFCYTYQNELQGANNKHLKLQHYSSNILESKMQFTNKTQNVYLKYFVKYNERVDVTVITFSRLCQLTLRM